MEHREARHHHVFTYTDDGSLAQHITDVQAPATVHDRVPKGAVAVECGEIGCLYFLSMQSTLSQILQVFRGLAEAQAMEQAKLSPYDLSKLRTR